MLLKRSNTLFVLLATLLFLVPVFSLFQLANAATPSSGDAYFWESKSSIINESQKINFVDLSLSDTTDAYGYGSTPENICYFDDALGFGGGADFGDIKESVGSNPIAFIDIGKKPSKSTKSGTLYIVKPSDAKDVKGTKCKIEAAGNVTIGNAEILKNTTFYSYSDTYTIKSTGGSDKTFKLVSPQDKAFYDKIAASDNVPASSVVYAENISNDCKSFIVLNKSARNNDPTPSSGTLVDYTATESGGCARGVRGGSSGSVLPSEPRQITISNSTLFNLTSVKSATVEETQAATDDQGSGQTAEGACSDALSPFGWILCPLLSFASSAYNFFVTWVNQVLFFDSNSLNNSGVGDLRNVVSVFIRIANVLLVLFALVMIAGQIFNFEIFSAYTLKKMLPRLFIGAIAIQFSWIIFTLLIQIVNAIGTGIYGLLLVPFGYNLSDGYITIQEVFNNATNSSGATGGSNFVGFIFGASAAAGAVAAITIANAWLSIIVAAIGVLISLLVAIITLVVRQVIIVVLLAVAPLAIALWIFPGTTRFWEMWWKSFSRLLMMYPLIMLLFAAGTMGAHILLSSGSSVITEVSAIIAFFAPIFMISMTYKFAGAAFGSIASFSNKANSRLKGSGMFGLRNQAKMRKENSAFANTMANRKENLAKKLQDQSAARITGTGKYDKGFRRFYSKGVQRSSSGLVRANEENLTRAQARAGNQIMSEEEKAFKNRGDLVEFQVHETARRLRAENSELRDVDQFAIEQQVRAAMISGAGSLSAEFKDSSGRTFNHTIENIPKVSESMREDVALAGLKNKDDTDQLRAYYQSDAGFQALKDRGTADKAAWSVLVEKLPTAAKGAQSADLSKIIVTRDDETGIETASFAAGFDDGVKNFGALAKTQQKEIGAGLKAMLRRDPEKVKTILNDLARNTPGVTAQNLIDLENELGIDLQTLRRDPNAKLE